MWVDGDYEKKEDLGIDVEYTEGKLWVNTNHICAHHPNDENQTMIRLTNGDVFISPMEHKDFLKILNEITVTIELQPSSN